MATNAADGFRSTANQTTHSKEDALDEVEFELLFEGASSLDDYYGIQAQFVILVLGRLGLRRGELCHMRESWVDWRNEEICIPRQQDCHGERQGDGPCGYCKQLARQRAEVNEGISYERALEDVWKAKTDAAARGVYFGFDPRVQLFIERFFDRFDSWTWSATAINRRVDKAAAAADGVSVDEVRPHSLRATAATNLAGKGADMHSLMQFFGWAQPETAEFYIARNSTATARQLDAIHQG
ncbi:site-specific integrase [Halosimplex halophilum]|uniref:site-specific integrase n=1 Tax=Halosimplex halophilum TaxID=2559572 RepID=UPI001435651F|nr:site-specific integrase [Halosimplex halophilum]